MITQTLDKPIQIRIFPQRLLQAATAERVLNEIDKVDGVPGTGSDVNHPDRKVIHVGDCALELHIIVGEIVVEVNHENAAERVRKACERGLPFPFEFKQGHFIKRRPTLTDYGKYGFRSRTDERINLDDERMLGLTDPDAKAEGNICVIGTYEK
jgi:methyl-coenzyme M reductase subunit D